MVSNEKLHHHILFPLSFQPIDTMEIAFFSIFSFFYLSSNFSPDKLPNKAFISDGTINCKPSLVYVTWS